MNGYENVANAIVIQAAKDFRRNIMILKNDPENEKASVDKQGIEKFFRSSWFQIISKANPDYILDRLKRG